MYIPKTSPGARIPPVERHSKNWELTSVLKKCLGRCEICARLPPRAACDSLERSRSPRTLVLCAGGGLLPSRPGPSSCKMLNLLFMTCAEGQSLQSITCLSTPPADPPQGYVDQQLVGSGHVTKGAIIGLDGSQWAISPGFNVIAYPHPIPPPKRSQQGQARGRRRATKPHRRIFQPRVPLCCGGERLLESGGVGEEPSVVCIGCSIGEATTTFGCLGRTSIRWTMGAPRWPISDVHRQIPEIVPYRPAFGAAATGTGTFHAHFPPPTSFLYPFQAVKRHLFITPTFTTLPPHACTESSSLPLSVPLPTAGGCSVHFGGGSGTCAALRK